MGKGKHLVPPAVPRIITMDNKLLPTKRLSPGWWVWRMCGEPKVAVYKRRFDFQTLKATEQKWALMRASNVLVFGLDTCAALNLPRVEPMDPQTTRMGTWWYLPFPSGRCHWYDSPLRWTMAASLLQYLMKIGVYDDGSIDQAWYL